MRAAGAVALIYFLGIMALAFARETRGQTIHWDCRYPPGAAAGSSGRLQNSALLQQAGLVIA